ncbi:MAG: hypothetical protein ACD_56C00021G0005 [uncultured bacterium]|nr:MAG: hypothetical protein ACD_56C00021G0005 [uncultured bacterium]
MLDLTKKIQLDPPSQKRYLRLRLLLHVFFFLALVFVANSVLFPSQSLDLFFDNINSTKNTIVNPRLPDGKIPPKGSIEANNDFTFNANPTGNFSSVNVTFKTDADSNAENILVSTRKSYQAFLYPLGQPLGFKTGSLLTTPDGNYYIVSNGLLRKFANTNIILDFGYPKNSFIPVLQDDLANNANGPEISSSNTYPDDTLFFINERFYQLKSGRLLAFVSDRAFLSQYDTAQAIPKQQSIFEIYPSSEEVLGFVDATLASAGNSVFILSKGESFPIADSNTFLEMGFSWDNVVALESDEFGSYEQQKQFDRNQKHPDGTLFHDEATGEYFMIENEKRHPIPSGVILKTYKTKNAIPVDQKGSERTLHCSLAKKFLRSNSFDCQLPISELAGVIGNDYQFETAPNSQIKIKQINLIFSTPLSWSNMKSSLSKIKENLKNNYTK